MRSFRPWVIGLVLLWAALFSLPPALAREAALDKAVLAADWAKVAALLEKDDAKAKDPVARLLMSHARLALNRNNNATVLFRSVTEGKDLADWKAWADKLVQARPASPVAIYLAADAAARSGDLKAAIAGFGRAIEADPKFALALNARGVALAAGGEVDAALIALSEAKRRAPNLADAQASYGTFAVLQGWPPSVSEEPLEAFESALRLDQTFALAYNGHGCLYFGDGKFEEAAADFQKAVELLPSLAIIDANEGIAVAYATRQLTLASLDANPSMALVSINRRDELVKEEDRDLQRLIPDQSIRDKILVYPHLSPAEQSELRNKAGKELIIRVQAVELHKADAQMWRLHREQLQLNKDIRAGARLARVLAVVEGVASVGTAAWNSVNALKEGWKAYVGGRGLPKDVATITAADARDRRMDLIKYLGFGGNPVITTAISSLKIAQDVNNDRLGANDARSQMLYNQFMAQALKSQASSQILADLGADWKPARVSAPSPSVSRSTGPSWVASSVPLSRLPTPTRPIANGVMTEAIGHAIVDKGNWPVMTTFTLGYRPASEAGAR